jgi:hypothetical protein
MATKTRSSMAKDAKKRALMKDIDEREAEEDAKSFVHPWYPFDGVTAKSALRKASDANIDGDYKRPKIAQVIRALKILCLAETVIFVALKSMVTML